MSLIFLTVLSTHANSSSNVLLSEWSGPFGGVPPFDKIKSSLFKPAFKEAMDSALKDIEKITMNTEKVTFENTIVPYIQSGRKLSRVNVIFDVWTGSLSSPEVKKLEAEMSPKLALHNDKIIQNAKLFARIDQLSASPELKKLSLEQQRLVKIIHTSFVLMGAKLSLKDKKKLSKINEELSTLSTRFAQNQLADEENDYLVIETRAQLSGLPEVIVTGAAEEAKRVGLTGKWVIPNTRSYMEPLLIYSPFRDLRQKAFIKWTSRGENKNANNNIKLISKIMELRTKRAKLLGFSSHAEWKLKDTMAQNPQAAMDLMLRVWKPGVEQVKKDVKELQALVDAEKGNFKIAPWDYRYYAEKLRVAKYDVDFNLVKPFLRLENIQKAMFWVAKEVFELDFVAISDVPVFHPSVSVYKVVDKKGIPVGLWYFDPFARQGKRSGAWMADYREQSRMGGREVLPIVSNNSNFVEGAGGATELSWDDAITMFHEFGHAIHGLSSNVTYPTLAGTNVPRDYVEFPSQVYENWLLTPQVMKFLIDKDGKQIPASLVKKIEAAKYFNKGFDTVELLSSAIVDMKIHLSSEKIKDAADFEKKTLKEIGMPEEIVMRHRLPHFGHIFSGGYDAGYYSYVWSQVLDKDAFEAYTEKKNFFDRQVSRKLKEFIFSKGNTMDPAEAYRMFRGRDPSVDALLRSSGFM